MSLVHRMMCMLMLASLASGCNLLKRGKGGDDVVNAEKGDDHPTEGKATIQDEQELKVAKLWARVDELEEEVFRQKERLRLLEKGLLTGIAPDGLTSKEKKPATEMQDAPPLVAEESPAATKPAAGETESNELNLAEQEEYSKRLETARGFFTSARYGKAITEYEKILATYGDKVDAGFVKYWIGRSWRQLKEYSTAEEILNEVLEKHPASPWIPRVHYELAKVYIDANNLASAREKLKFIKNKYQYEDVSELATRELEELPKKL